MHPIVPLLQLVHSLNRIGGRKKLQKMVHILKELGAPFNEPFQYSFYGMYSLQLKNEIAKLEADDLVKEELETGWGGHDTYAIFATPVLKELVDEFNLGEPPRWADLAHRLNEMSPQKLEGISTVLFLKRTEQTDAGVKERLLSLKPHLANLADDCIATASMLPSVN